ncbi:MAG: hypothetical protein WD648_05520 [Planctomycetaceae bacterium]
MKKTITRKVPGYKWVVEDLCPQCAANCAPDAAPADGKGVPPAPAAEASAAGYAPVPPVLCE